MNLDSTRARHTLAVFGILWNATIVGVVLISGALSFGKPRRSCKGGFAVVLMGLAWSRRDGIQHLRLWQNIAFLVAAALIVLGALSLGLTGGKDG
jgi:hypothetical protein